MKAFHNAAIHYQKRDLEVIDYHLYSLPEEKGKFIVRGPKPKSLDKGEYFACVGPAYTFGCFCEKPYATLLEERLECPVLNLSFGAAGPALFLQDPQLVKYLNGAKFVVLLLMSGRSEGNSQFECKGNRLYRRISDGKYFNAEQAYQNLLDLNDLENLKKIVAETRANYIRNFETLLSKIQVPKILFWFSMREPNYTETYESLHSLFSDFPQLVNDRMVHQIRDRSDEYVECVSRRGKPHKLISRFTGEPATIEAGFGQVQHNFYASPEMHEDAANALEPICRKYR